MKNLKIISFQRNGVAGNGFYVATCNEFGKDFVVTFETDEVVRTDTGLVEFIDIASCRAVCLSDLAEKWRGDDFAVAIQKLIGLRIARSPYPDITIYDLIEKETK